MGNNYFINIPGGGGGSGDVTAAYLLVSGSQAGQLAYARTPVAGNGILVADGGPGGNWSIATNITVQGGLSSSISNGQLILIGSGATGPSGSQGVPGTSGDPNASYVVMGLTSSLTNERVLTAGSGITISDGGANGNVTISNNGAILTGSIFGNSSGSNFALVAGGSLAITTQTVIFVSTSAGAATLSLPLPSVGRTILFKDVQGSANTNPFTVYPTGGSTIDAASASLAFNINYGALKLICDGFGWFSW